MCALDNARCGRFCAVRVVINFACCERFQALDAKTYFQCCHLLVKSQDGEVHNRLFNVTNTSDVLGQG